MLVDLFAVDEWYLVDTAAMGEAYLEHCKHYCLLSRCHASSITFVAVFSKVSHFGAIMDITLDT